MKARSKSQWPIVRVILATCFGIAVMCLFVPDAKRYFSALVGHTVTLLAGCTATVLLGLLQRYVFKKPISIKWEGAIILGFVFFAGFLAWRDEHHTANEAKERLKILTAPEFEGEIDLVTARPSPDKGSIIVIIAHVKNLGAPSIAEFSDCKVQSSSGEKVSTEFGMMVPFALTSSL